MIHHRGLVDLLVARKEVVPWRKTFAAMPSFQRWVHEIASPGLLRLMTKNMGAVLDQAGAPFKFGPPEGPLLYAALRWKPIEVRLAAEDRREAETTVVCGCA